jgi:hypothetical protein
MYQYARGISIVVSLRCNKAAAGSSWTECFGGLESEIRGRNQGFLLRPRDCERNSSMKCEMKPSLDF